jgi:hypothetical protein
MSKWSESKRKRWKGWLDTRDAKVQTFGAADYDDYVANMLVSGGAVFGRGVPSSNPVHPLFLDRLEAASSKARAAIGSDDFGVRTISGQDNRPGNHAWGLAVDIDPDANPYILNEAQDVGIDERVAPVYQRIAQALLHRDSVITRPTPKTTKDPGRKSGLEGATYTQVAEESDAMVAYFSVLPTPPPAADPGKGKKAAAAPAALPEPRKLTSVRIDPADVAALDKARVQADSDILTGKGERKGTSGDFPFEGAGAGRWRDPKRGFFRSARRVGTSLIPDLHGSPKLSSRRCREHAYQSTWMALSGSSARMKSMKPRNREPSAFSTAELSPLKNHCARAVRPVIAWKRSMARFSLSYTARGILPPP